MNVKSVILQELGLPFSIVLEFIMSKKFGIAPPFVSSLFVSHSTSIVIWCPLIVVNDLVHVVMISKLVHYLDGYLSSEWPFQVIIKWTLHHVCAN